MDLKEIEYATVDQILTDQDRACWRPVCKNKESSCLVKQLKFLDRLNDNLFTKIIVLSQVFWSC